MDRLMARKEILRLIPYSNRHLYRLEKAGKFPRRIKLGRRVGWFESAIEEFMNALKSRSDRA